MDLKDLRYFIAAYESRRYSSASSALGTSPSNLSARMLKLERSLGELLFERKWRRMVPTEKGEELYVCAKQVIGALDDAERAFGPRSLPARSRS